MQRLDVFLTENQHVKSRERAKRAICDGFVRVDGVIVKKPSFVVDGHENIVIENNDDNIYVGRGGLKLKKAIEYFHLNLTGCVCMDIGASTGGFTDCMLKNGANKVYAVDVGTDQLDEVLRKDSRVLNLEKTDVRNLDITEYSDISFVSADVSFISIKHILPIIAKLLFPSGESVVLIKPQFEAGRNHIGKGGIVKDQKVHLEVVKKVIDNACELGLSVLNFTFSPISNGNIEYLMHLSFGQSNDNTKSIENKVSTIIEEAFAYFGM